MSCRWRRTAEGCSSTRTFRTESLSCCARGFDATHVRDHGLQHADDEAIFDFAAADGSVLVSEDTDFGEILATRGAKVPSLVLLRSAEPVSPDDCADLLADNLPTVASALSSGSLVVIARGRMRIRTLPFGRGE